MGYKLGECWYPGGLKKKKKNLKPALAGSPVNALKFQGCVEYFR